MLVKTAFALSVAALATAAPLQETRRSINLSERDLVDTAVGTTIGKNSGAAVIAKVSDSGDIDTATAAKLGQLLGLDATASLGLGRLLRGLLHKRDDIVNTNVGATLGKNSGADASVVIGDGLDTEVDVDAKLGHLLGLDTHVSLGLSKLLKGLLGGLLGKREVATEQLYKRANDDLVDVGTLTTIGKGSYVGATTTVGDNLDTQVDVASKLGNLLGLKLDAGVSLSNLLKGLITIHHKRDDVVVSSDLELLHLLESNVNLRLGLSQLLQSLVHVDIKTKRSVVDSSSLVSADASGVLAATAATVGSSTNAVAAVAANANGVATSVKGNVGQITTDTEATLSSASGLDLGSYVAGGNSVVGAGLLTGDEGIDAGLVSKLGNILGVTVDAKTTPILTNLLKGLISIN
ncbi:uncharacterized protein JCM6883_005859 [Sporobolomyces salmoneus]|uniref:uncharacterized protein n=1 Tax=Sporobolomyces salmoneus TaxID=183962 RepID=UPI003172AB2F